NSSMSGQRRWTRTFYRPLSVRVALTGLEIWSDQDKIRVDKSPSDTLNRFLEWRTRELLPRLRHDNAQLIMGESFDGTTVGMASQSSMCSKDRSGGVNVDHLVSVLGVASTIAHELGHNLGMNHDTADRRCQCQNEPRLGGCIMEPSTGFMPGQLFSSCSARDLSLSLLHGGGMCLFNVPQPEKLLGGPRCGNLYVEKGEECDCGLLDECNDPCCNATTCKLVPGAQCSSDGICCDNCKLRTGGWMCRQPLGECDLPEHCTGASPYCPPNVFLQNGEPCEEGASYCYSGVCASFNTQCQMLWGPNSTRAPSVCFSSVNKQGNKYGNCGQMPNGTYIPCPSKDVHCGRLQCQGGNDRPLLGTSAEILTTKVKFNYSDFVCRGTYFHLGDDVSDPAMVAQGTACGLGKACWNQRCQDVSLFGVDDCQSKCNGHGVCNSNKNCHCDVGWAPPDCRSTGHGGSVDSGPARAPRETQPKTPNSKQCRCRSMVASKNSLERPEPRKKPREEPGYEGWPVLFWLCRVEIITEHGQDVKMFIDDQQGQIIIIIVVVEGATGQHLRSKCQLAFHSRSLRVSLPLLLSLEN
uniref:ADAM metallopeptidase domain 15 n=1 Tax=Oncorhynchus mykiss TaxID=8022 RepID=A0A8C7RAY0_ONCMY